MSRLRPILFGLVVVSWAGGRLWPESVAIDAVQYGVLGLLVVHIALQVRMGYRRRRPHWTAASWQRYLALMMIPIGAVLLLTLLVLARQQGWVALGEPRSIAWNFWAAGVVLASIAALVGLPVGIDWFAEGDPARQLDWPRWVGR